MRDTWQRNRWVILCIALVAIGAYFVRSARIPRRAPRSYAIKLTESNALALTAALDCFKKDCGVYPTDEQGLEALLRQPRNMEKWNGPYIDSGDSIPADGWGTHFRYSAVLDKNQRHEVVSAGPDKQFDTEDDIIIGNRLKK